MRNHSNSIKIRHTASAKDRLKQAHKLLGLTNLLAGELEEIFNNWSRIKITDNKVKHNYNNGENFWSAVSGI
jgi:hypothetical protein